MKRIVVLLALSSVIPLFAADDPTTAPTTASAAKKTVKKTAKPVKKTAAEAPATKIAQPLAMPKEATPNGDGTFSYTDKQGKQWRYANTPFGVSRVAASEVPGAGIVPAIPSVPAQHTKAIDRGDTVRFETATPFGTTAWEKKKSDLTDDERHLLESQNAASQPAAAPTASAEAHD
jgi:hypothetical protein